MPILEFDRIIEEYYNKKIKDKYPDITLEQLIKICKAPFWFFNKSMGREDLPTVNIKYLGKLVVLPSNIEEMLKNNRYNLKVNRIDKDEYEKRKQHLENILKEIKIDYEQAMEFDSEN